LAGLYPESHDFIASRKLISAGVAEVGYGAGKAWMVEASGEIEARYGGLSDDEKERVQHMRQKGDKAKAFAAQELWSWATATSHYRLAVRIFLPYVPTRVSFSSLTAITANSSNSLGS